MKIHEVYDFMLTNFIDCMCICETFCKSSTILHGHPEFFIYRCDRPDEIDKGGVLVLVNRNLSHKVLSTVKTRLIENIGIELMFENRTIEVFSCYLPGGATSHQIRTNYGNDLKLLTRKRKTFFNLGDWNSKHRLWNCLRANTAGNILFEKLNRNNFTIFHPYEHTHHPSDPRKQPSTIDLGITNCSLPITNLRTHPLGSDHLVVSFTVEFDNNIRFNSPSVRPCYKLANWDRYKVLLEARFSVIDFDHRRVTSHRQVDELITLLVDSMRWAESKSIPLKAIDKYALQLTTEIKDKIAERGIIQRRWQRCVNPLYKPFLKNLMNRLSLEIKNEISELRNENWAAKLQTIKDDDNHKGLWQVNKFVKKRGNKIPPLKLNETLHTTPAEKAQVLANTFASAHNNPLSDDDPNFTTQVESEVRAFLEVLPNSEDIESPAIFDTENVVKGLKSSKSPGLDKINNRLIKKLPRSGMLLLHLIIVACFKLCYFPDTWKLANVIAIKKPGKNPIEPASYRPISLLSSLSKVLERVILSRLRLFVEDNDVLPPEQHGFVRGKSTIHQLKRLTDHIQEGFAERG